MAAKIDVKQIVEVISREITIVVGVLKEKGSKRFGRTYILTGFLVLAAYFGVYTPPQKKSARLADEIKRQKTLFDFSKKYIGMRDQLALAYVNLPDSEGRDQWLSNSVRDSLNAGGLIPDDFRPVREELIGGLAFQSTTLAVNARFSDFFDWLLRIESAKPMMQMTTVELGKKGGTSGFNSVNVGIATVIPVKRYR